MGFSEIIHGQILGPVGVARYAEYARHIFDSGVHLSAQFEQMLDLAQAETGRLSLARKRFAPARLIDATVTNLSAAAENAAVRLDVQGDFTAWPEMEGDEVKLQRSVTNLIDNAIKFSRPGAVVTIRGLCAGRMLKLVIADRGIGIRPEELELVVRPFHRGRRAFDAVYQGAGLGLPFAKSIIELHGGSLAIESQSGVGTTVTVCLPIALVPEMADAA